MKYNFTILLLIGLSLLTTGCATKKCIGPNIHNGLYNALNCNYDLNIQDLTLSLNDKTLERNKLFNQFQRLIAKVTNKNEVINGLDEDIKIIDDDLSSITILLKDIKKSIKQPSTISVLKLKQKLNKLNMDILNKSTFFDLEDAEFTKNQLLTKDDLSSEKYAKVYTENTSSEKFAKVYNENTSKEKFAKAYFEDIEKNRQMKVALANKLKTIANSLNTSNIKASQENIASILQDAQRYSDSLKSS